MIILHTYPENFYFLNFRVFIIFLCLFTPRLTPKIFQILKLFAVMGDRSFSCFILSRQFVCQANFVVLFPSLILP